MEDISQIKDMNIIKKLSALKEQFKNDTVVRGNGTLLLAPGTIPRSRHMLFKPLTDELIEEYLKKMYVLPFPKEYEAFLKFTNGANLFTIKWTRAQYSLALCMFCVFGLPRTQPFGRPDDREEPFDVRIEDLSHPDKMPKHRLKIGGYTLPSNYLLRYGIYIDTETERVYSHKDDDPEVAEEWDSLDQCLCEIFDRLAAANLIEWRES